MEKLQVTAMVPAKDDKPQIGPFTIEIDTGSTAAEDIELYGDQVVKSNFDANVVVTVQSNMRSGMKRGESQEQMQARLAGYKPGVAAKGVKVDPVQAYLAMFASASPEKQAEMLAELKDRASK